MREAGRAPGLVVLAGPNEPLDELEREMPRELLTDRFDRADRSGQLGVRQKLDQVLESALEVALITGLDLTWKSVGPRGEDGLGGGPNPVARQRPAQRVWDRRLFGLE